MIGPGGLQLLIWFDSYMLLALLACCIVAGYGLERRPLFGLRLAVAAAVECLWAGVWTYQWILAKAPLWEPGGIVICKYLGTYLLTIGTFRLCLRCGWSAALYGGTTGYILQHCAERITEIAQAALGIPPGWGEKLLLAACTALICLCFVLVFRNRYDISEYDRYSNGEGDVMLLTAAPQRAPSSCWSR